MGKDVKRAGIGVAAPPGEREGGYSGRRVTDGVKVALLFAVVVGTLRVRLQFMLRCEPLTSWEGVGRVDDDRRRTSPGPDCRMASKQWKDGKGCFAWTGKEDQIRQWKVWVWLIVGLVGNGGKSIGLPA